MHGLYCHSMLILNMCALQSPHLPISVPQFSVGQNKSCNLWLKDQPVSKILCRLRQLEACLFFSLVPFFIVQCAAKLAALAYNVLLIFYVLSARYM